jgi:hypothetical protein
MVPPFVTRSYGVAAGHVRPPARVVQGDAVKRVLFGILRVVEGLVMALAGFGYVFGVLAVMALVTVWLLLR